MEEEDSIPAAVVLVVERRLRSDAMVNVTAVGTAIEGRLNVMEGGS